jgi:prophage regulatory protein
MEMPDKMMRKAQVLECTGLSDAALYREIKAGRFPKPMQIAQKSVAWPVSAVIAWQEGLKESTIVGGPGKKQAAS